MSTSRLILTSFAILFVLAGIPHFFGQAGETGSLLDFLTQNLEWETVESWFYVFNELSIVYLIIPFFVVELIRYGFLNKLSKDVIYDSITNLITVFAFTAMEYILGILFLTKFYFLIYEHVSLGPLPLNWLTILSCILLADFAYYWDHRMMHRISIGWATHTVHHSSPHFNMSVAFRFGPLDAIFPILFSIPLVMLGFDPILVLLSEVFVQTFQAILHTEVIGKLPKPIELIFNTPSHHRVHHGSNRQYWDKNYAGILIIWDRMLGTFEPEVETVVYGIDKPVNSTNPVKVFFHGLTRLAQTIKETEGWKNKLLLLIKAPGWSPKKKQLEKN